jgi:hypothetical protein
MKHKIFAFSWEKTFRPRLVERFLGRIAVKLGTIKLGSLDIS